MIQFLTDDECYSANCLEHQFSLFADSPFGLTVRTVSDNGLETKWSSTHPGKYLAVMAELGITTNVRIRARSANKIYTIADIVRDDAMQVHRWIEPEWTLIGLARYLKIKQWRNRFGERISFDEMSQWLLDRSTGRGACFGCHLLHALASIRQIDQRFNIIRKSTTKHIEEKLTTISNRLSETQRDDGSWAPNWFGSTSSLNAFSWGSDDWDRVAATGHHLEWTALVPERLRPSCDILGRALAYLVRIVPQLAGEIQHQWQLYLPASHAVKAAWTICGREFPPSTTHN